MLLVMGLLRLGFLANFLSHPVISGFVTASALLITASQLKTLMGVKAEGHNLVDLLAALLQQVPHTHGLTLAIGVFATAFLFWVRKGLKPLLMRLGASAKAADLVTKAGPVAAIAATTGAHLGAGVAGAGCEGRRHGAARPAAAEPAAPGISPCGANWRCRPC